MIMVEMDVLACPFYPCRRVRVSPSTITFRHFKASERPRVELNPQSIVQGSLWYFLQRLWFC